MVGFEIINYLDQEISEVGALHIVELDEYGVTHCEYIGPLEAAATFVTFYVF